MLINITDREPYEKLVEIMEMDEKTKKAVRTAMNPFLFADTKWDICHVRASIHSNGEQNILLEFSQHTQKGTGPVGYKFYYRPYLDENNKMVRKSIWEKKELKQLPHGGSGTTISTISIKKIRQEIQA